MCGNLHLTPQFLSITMVLQWQYSIVVQYHCSVALTSSCVSLHATQNVLGRIESRVIIRHMSAVTLNMAFGSPEDSSAILHHEIRICLVGPSGCAARRSSVSQWGWSESLKRKISWFGSLVGKHWFSSGKCPQGDTLLYEGLWRMS